ncbi:MAG: carboxylating nicotinate-nucleotide diphosphorylase [Deltaproteobacteria bacterium]|jgi:nicotinate-nucleotide pyrophosphorylase (carboxylating)|nr:carboxylating nicotinate-nucleotide diphosphorylase [Deltaproteobacteria bacterium]MBW2537241.1 carboxylating nicotinate-nucleotide diphosphorylase [Deltaproteobacteria bacterium]
MALATALLDELIDRALAEDLGSGDITSQCCIDAGRRATGRALARADMVVCGGPLFARVFRRLDPEVKVTLLEDEGARVGPDTPLWQVEGRARSLLSAERVALNFAGRLSGIATVTRRYVDALPAGTATRITDTRKTTPGLRPLERYAVRVGGGHNHRDNLAAAVLIKDNHIVAAGGIEAAVALAKQQAPHTCRIEVEVTSLQELDQALAAEADIVLLDNMSDELLARAVERVRQHEGGRRPLLEASGNMHVPRLAAVAATGVDAISVGALTHSAPVADISLEFAYDDGVDP